MREDRIPVGIRPCEYVEMAFESLGNGKDVYGICPPVNVEVVITAGNRFWDAPSLCIPSLIFEKRSGGRETLGKV